MAYKSSSSQRESLGWVGGLLIMSWGQAEDTLDVRGKGIILNSLSEEVFTLMPQTSMVEKSNMVQYIYGSGTYGGSALGRLDMETRILYYTTGNTLDLTRYQAIPIGTSDQYFTYDYDSGTKTVKINIHLYFHN